MESIKGIIADVQSKLEEYLTKIDGTTLCHSRRSEMTIFPPKYDNMAAQIYIHISFTGDTWHTVFRISNKAADLAQMKFATGDIKIVGTMREAAKSAVELFSNYGYKAVRALLLLFGANLAGAIGEFAEKFDCVDNENNLELKMRQNETEVLQDVDWIEELMEEAGMQPQ